MSPRPFSAFPHEALTPGGLSDGGHRCDPKARRLVERADQRPMAGVVGRLVGLDARRLRLHGVLADHGAYLQGVRCFPDGSVGGAAITLWMRLVGARASLRHSGSCS